MTTLKDALENHQNTTSYAVASDGMIPDVGETVYNDTQSMICKSIDINQDGLVTVEFDSGAKVGGQQIAEMFTKGIVKIK